MNEVIYDSSSSNSLGLCTGDFRKKTEKNIYDNNCQFKVSTVYIKNIPMVSLLIDGKERLCLAQISNTLLNKYSYNEIHNRRVALGINCIQCTPVQLEILRRTGAMPTSSRRCGMITKREAERLVKSFLEENKPPSLPESFVFNVQHKCGWGCQGTFYPSRYNSSRAKCIRCFYCNLFYSPNKFIFHAHNTPGSKYVQPDTANFNSWRRHLTLINHANDDDLINAWEDVKAIFNGGTRKRILSNYPNTSYSSQSSCDDNQDDFETSFDSDSHQRVQNDSQDEAKDYESETEKNNVKKSETQENIDTESCSKASSLLNYNNNSNDGFMVKNSKKEIHKRKEPFENIESKKNKNTLLKQTHSQFSNANFINSTLTNMIPLPIPTFMAPRIYNPNGFKANKTPFELYQEALCSYHNSKTIPAQLTTNNSLIENNDDVSVNRNSLLSPFSRFFPLTHLIETPNKLKACTIPDNNDINLKKPSLFTQTPSIPTHTISSILDKNNNTDDSDSECLKKRRLDLDRSPESTYCSEVKTF